MQFLSILLKVYNILFYTAREPYLCKLLNLVLCKDGVRWALANFFVAAGLLLVYWLGGSVRNRSTKTIHKTPGIIFTVFALSLLAPPSFALLLLQLFVFFFFVTEIWLQEAVWHYNSFSGRGKTGYCYPWKTEATSVFPTVTFVDWLWTPNSLVEKQPLFSVPSTAVWLLLATSLLTWLWLAELGSGALRSGAVAGDNYSSAQIWWLADFHAPRVHSRAIYDSHGCVFWFRPVEAFCSLFITQTSPIYAPSFSHLPPPPEDRGRKCDCAPLVACQNFCFVCSALSSLNERRSSGVNHVMKKGGIFFIVFVVAALAGVVWRGLPESCGPGWAAGCSLVRWTAPCT